MKTIQKLSDYEKGVEELINEFMGTENVLYYDWNNLIPVARKLHEISKYKSVSFKSTTGYDIEDLYEDCSCYIYWLNNNKE